MAGPHQPSGLPDADLPHQKYMYVCMYVRALIRPVAGEGAMLSSFQSPGICCKPPITLQFNIFASGGIQ